MWPRILHNCCGRGWNDTEQRSHRWTFHGCPTELCSAANEQANKAVHYSRVANQWGSWRRLASYQSLSPFQQFSPRCQMTNNGGNNSWNDFSLMCLIFTKCFSQFTGQLCFCKCKHDNGAVKGLMQSSLCNRCKRWRNIAAPWAAHNMC